MSSVTGRVIRKPSASDSAANTRDAKLVKKWTGGGLFAIPVGSVIVTGGYLVGFPPWWPLRVAIAVIATLMVREWWDKMVERRRREAEQRCEASGI